MNPAPADRPKDASRMKDLVLIHGWGMNAGVWDALPKTLTADLRLHPIELPGHGGRPLLPPCDGGAGTLDAWADACLDAAPDQAVWLGWSLGGLVALAAALRATKHNPDRMGGRVGRRVGGHIGGRIQGLILITATPRFVRAPDWPAAMPPETLALFHDGLLADPAGTLSRFLALQVRGSDQARETLRGLRQRLATRPSPDPAALALGLDLLRAQDLRPALPRLRVPSLWLFGSQDTLVPAAAAGPIERLLPSARTRVIPGAAHAPFLSHPAQTREAIGAFLAGLVQRRPGQSAMGSDETNPTLDPESKGQARSRSA